jgi:uncharacterized membrane protein HdeD (DUF308 family)
MLQISYFKENGNELLEKFSKNSKIVGIVFIILGLVGIFYPAFMSVTSAIIFGWLLLFSGFFAGYHTYYNNKSDWLGWLKTFVLVFVGGLTIINPLPGVATLGILFSIYFAFDGFSSIALAFSSRGHGMWLMILLNGIISLILSFLFIADWPFGSMFYVGLFVGISLLVDGIVLLSLSNTAKILSDES